MIYRRAVLLATVRAEGGPVTTARAWDLYRTQSLAPGRATARKDLAYLARTGQLVATPGRQRAYTPSWRRPMTGPEHYREAERLADRAHHYIYSDGADPATGAALAAEAQVHATLAGVAAEVEHAAITAAAHDIGSIALEEWAGVLAQAGGDAG